MNIKAILTEAIEFYGNDHQCLKLIEECCELSAAMIRYRNYPNESNLDNLLEEIADVEIMIWQMSLIFNEKEINHVTFDKLSRLKDRMDIKKEKEK